MIWTLLPAACGFGRYTLARPLGLVGLIFVLAAGTSSAAESRAAGRPNLVVILADDLGWADLGSYGSTFHETPHLDRLAREGARLTAAYAACPVCSPTRASLLTGRWPQRTGVTEFIGAEQPDKWTRNTKLLPAPHHDRLELAEVTFAEALKAAGYATFFAGKWHLGPEGHWPEDQGFDVNRGGVAWGGPYGGKKYFSPYANPRLPDGPPGEHLTDRLAQEAAKFIGLHRRESFLVYLPFYDVHTPLMAREDLRLKYEAKRQRLGLAERWGVEAGSPVRLTQAHAVYAAMVEAMDLAVGKVLASLDEHGLAENTLVIFTSDNGGLSTSHGSPTSNQPMRAGKGWLYEGGIREPLIARWPGRIKPGLEIGTPVTSPDLMPTLLAAANVAPQGRLDGLSWLPLLVEGRALPDRALYWHYPHYANQGGAPGAAIRRGDWKLIEWFEDGRRELFNLAADPGETTELSARDPERVAQLVGELHVWQRDVKARFPTRNPAFKPDQPDGRRIVGRQ